jgi:signal transduction histidine kinase
MDSYSTRVTDFKETSEFQSKYLKYVERVAVYVDYREKGYNGSISYDSSSLDLSALFEKEVEKPESNSKNTQESQKDFDYYNNILNQPGSNFIYYVRNLKTGTVYYSASLEDEISRLTEEYGDKAMSKYLEKVKSENTSYLIINTDTEKFATNVNKKYLELNDGNQDYLNDENLNWVIDCINGYITADAESNAGNRGSYIVCTTISNNLSNKNDEFGTMYRQFQELYVNYRASLYPVPISFVLLLLFFILTIAFTGHKKNTNAIVLNGFDRIKSEIGFMFVVFGIYILFYAAKALSSFAYYNLNFEFHFIILIVYSILYPFCMFGLLSLIRRMKAEALISNSLLHVIIVKLNKVIRQFFIQKSITFRIFALIAVFTAMQILAFYLYHRPVLFSRKTEFLLISIPGYALLLYYLIRAGIDYNIIREETKKISEGNLTHKIPVADMHEPALALGLYINNISDGFSAAVDEKVKSERLKTELIANVSHDIKTPLTSIINYVDLLKKEKLDNEKANGYLDILSSKTWRLKTLIEDLMEASKASSGAIVLNLECINLVELVRQSIGEFEDRLSSHNLEIVLNIKEEPVYIMADGRSTYRIIENIFSNVNKYALSGTRVYVDITTDDRVATISVKNISASKLNINSDELMERFVRGDLSRNTEGSGLGLSIARSLAALQDALFEIELDGDLFKAMVHFPKLDRYTNEKKTRKETENLT